MPLRSPLLRHIFSPKRRERAAGRQGTPSQSSAGRSKSDTQPAGRCFLYCPRNWRYSEQGTPHWAGRILFRRKQSESGLTLRRERTRRRGSSRLCIRHSYGSAAQSAKARPSDSCTPNKKPWSPKSERQKAAGSPAFGRKTAPPSRWCSESNDCRCFRRYISIADTQLQSHAHEPIQC